MESLHEEEASDEIPQSLLSYFETSRSRAVVCERLILEDNEDFEEPYTVVNCSSSDYDLDSLDQLQINIPLISGSKDTDSLPPHRLGSDEVNSPEMEEALEEPVTEEQVNQTEELWTWRDRRVCEAQKMEEEHRQRESDFQLELRKLREAEQVQQAELELKAKSAQAKLEQEMLLQQEMMKDLKKRVAEESRRRLEEQAHFRLELERRREEEQRNAESLQQRRKDRATLTPAPSDVIKVSEVNMDALTKHRNQEQSNTNNTDQDKPITEENVNMKILESTQEDAIGKNVITTLEKTKRHLDDDEEKAEQNTMKKNDRKSIAKVSKEEKIQDLQSKVQIGGSGDVGLLSETQGKSITIEEEEGSNCDEDQSNLHKENALEKKDKECLLRNVPDQCNEKAATEPPKGDGKKKMVISCNFLRNSVTSKLNCGRDSPGIKAEIEGKGLKNKAITDSDPSPNESNISQEKGQNSNSLDNSDNNTGNKRSSRSDDLQNEFRGSTEIDSNQNKAAISVEERSVSSTGAHENAPIIIQEAILEEETSLIPLNQSLHESKDDESIRGNLSRENAEENKANISSNVVMSEPGDEGIHLENLSVKSQEMLLNNDNISRDLHEEDVLSNNGSTGNEYSKQVDFEVENCTEGLKEADLINHSPSSMNANKMCSKSQNTSEVFEDRGQYGIEENSNETEMLKALRECKDKQVSRNASQHENRKQNMTDILEARTNIQEDDSDGSHVQKDSNCHDISKMQDTDVETVKDSSIETAILKTRKEEGISINKHKDTEIGIGQEYMENEEVGDSNAQNDSSLPNELNGERHSMGCEDGGCWPGLCLPEQTEQKRLRWMRECVSWSKLSVRRKTRTKPGAVPRRRGPKRAARTGVDPLPPLAPQVMLRSTGLTTLSQLTTLTLQDMDLSGCSLSPLSQCLCLQSLSLRRCGLQALEHVNKLQQLFSIDAQENAITFVDCENMRSLRLLRLGQNRLSSIPGLNGADDLRELELQHNLITRIAGVESLSRLQSLSLSHNQLISSRGLSSLSSLLHLDLSHNQLDSVQGLDNCSLLCVLHLSGNSLTQPPDLKNQVLLRELHLDDNSISSLHSLTQHWLPMMQHLTAAQNSLTELPSMSDFVSLETLDLQFNCISELSAVCDRLRPCPFIRDVCLEGNPLQQEPGWRSTLQTMVPGLRCIDGQATDSSSDGPGFCPVAGSFLSLCQSQILQTVKLQQRHSSQISTTCSHLDLVKLSSRHLEEVFGLAEEHRFQHEFGDTSLTSESEREGSALEEPPGEVQGDPQQNESEEAAVIQQQTPRPRPSTDSGQRPETECSAICIQAWWRGVSLRRRLRAALTKARCPDPGWDEGLEVLEVDGFVLDEASLDLDWSLPSSEDFTERHVPELERPQSSQACDLLMGDSLWVPPLTDFRTKQAWTEEQNTDTKERASPSDSVRSKSPPSPAVLHRLSERSQKLMEEWGFSDSHTALLMLKRARKMKSKGEQHKLTGAESEQMEAGSRNHWNTSSECFLPKLSRDILNGGRVQLVTEPSRPRGASQSSSSISSNPTNSEVKSKMELPCPKRGASPPIKKERISFRDNKLQLSGGWGSGKRGEKSANKTRTKQD